MDVLTTQPTAATRAELPRSRLARLWWAFLLAGWLAWVCWRLAGWAFIGLNPSLAQFSWRVLVLHPGAAVGAGGGFLVWAAWRLLARWEASMRSPVARAAAAVTLAVLMVTGADLALRRAAAQDAFWLAINVRASGLRDYYVRETMRLRLDHLAAAGDRSGGLLLLGGSQLGRAVDISTLQSSISGLPVHKRCLPGMYFLRMCGMQPFTSLSAPCTVVMFGSEVEVDRDSRSGGFEASWLRPYVSLRSLCDLLGVLDARLIAGSWRQFVDLGMASVSELWRDRDAFRTAVFNLFGAESIGDSAFEKEMVRQIADYAGHDHDPRFEQASLRAVRCVIESRMSRGDRVVVVEGRLNPRYETERTRRLRVDVREWFSRCAQDMGFTYVPVSEQVEIGQDDWEDMSHLNAQGREKFTQWLVDYLRTNADSLHLETD